jgi:hypothetical protein
MPSLESAFPAAGYKCVVAVLLIDFPVYHFSRFAAPVLLPESATGGAGKVKSTIQGKILGADFRANGMIYFGLIWLLPSE